MVAILLLRDIAIQILEKKRNLRTSIGFTNVTYVSK